MQLIQSKYGGFILWCIMSVLSDVIYSQIESSDATLLNTYFQSAVTIHNGTPESPGSSSITITAPAVNTGDVLVAQITVAADFSPSNAICTPPGWISLYKNNFENIIIQQIFYFLAESDKPETSYTWYFKRNNGACGTDGNNLTGKGATGGIIQYSGVDPVNPIDTVAGSVATGSGVIATAPSVTTTANDSRVIRFFSAFKDLTFTTTNDRIYTTGSSNNSTERTAAAYHTTQQNAGPTAAFNASLSSSAEWVSATVALRPAEPPEYATSLVYKVQPTNTVAGETISPAIEVSAIDENNNIIESFNGAISISIDSNPANGTLSGTTQTNAQNGIAYFDDLSIDNAGNNYTLLATANELTATISNEFDVLSGKSDSIVIISGNNQHGLINIPLDNPFVVEVRDHKGNPVSGGSVYFAITETPSGASGQSLSNTTGTTNIFGRTSTTFTPGNKSGIYRVSASFPGANEVTFTADVPVYLIAGTVTESDIPLENVTVKASGGYQHTETTNSSGQYSFMDIPAGTKDITIKPSKTGYAFSPEYSLINEPLVQNLTNINFSTLPPPAPVLISPYHGSSDMNIPVMLEWETTEHTLSYNVQVATDTSFEQPGLVVNVTSITTPHYTVRDLGSGMTYYWRVNAANPSGVSEWSAIWSFSTQTITHHTIELQAGWNTISSYVAPLDDAITNLFSDIAHNLVIVKDGMGNIYNPAFDINNIPVWKYEQGYQLYMYPDPDTLTIIGHEINPELALIKLNQGWNMVSYLRTYPMDPTVALKSIEHGLIIAISESGHVYIPAGTISDDPINTMGFMYPGVGYRMYVSGDLDLVYPGNTSPSARMTTNDISSSVGKLHTTQNVTVYPSDTRTGNNAILIIESNDFFDGDEIGVWSESGKIVGGGIVQNGIAIVTIWGNDAFNKTTNDGAEPNELLKLTIWSAELRKESKLTLLSLTDITGQTAHDTVLRYQPNAIWRSVAEKDDKLPESFALYQNYPNPFNPFTMIRFVIPDHTYVSLIVYNTVGQRVIQLVDDELESGTHEITFDASHLPSGVYIYRLQAGEYIENKKLLLLK